MTQAPVTHAPSDSPNVLILPPLLYGVALAAGFLLQWTAPRPILASNARYWAGGVLLASGVLIAIWGRRVMDRAGTNVNPALPATALVVSGPFRFSRNPLYVALTLVYVGLALIVPVLLVLHYGAVRRERSEEHTSELQSLAYLVCRLLLEKKKLT